MPDPSSVLAAARVAEDLLASTLPRRWAHVQGVAAKAETAAARLKYNGDVLVIAAWLHDVGYASGVKTTGFHPLDGARFLQYSGVADRVCGLIAHHSAARIEALYFGCSEELEQFVDEQTVIRDLLWYCDMTVGPDGRAVTFSSRMREIRTRYAKGHYVIRALDASMLERMAAITRAEAWIHRVGLAGQV